MSALLSQVLFGRTRQAILSLFFTRPDESFYLREVVRRTGKSPGAIQRELAQLSGCGILRKERDKFFRANPDSPAFEPLKQLVVRTMGVADGLKEALQIYAEEIAVAFLFGSFARGDQRSESDLDLMVISRRGKPTLEQITIALKEQQHTLGREINPFLLTASELRAKWSEGNHFLRRVLEGDKIFLIGDVHELKRLAEKRMAQAARDKPRGNRRSAVARRS